VCVCVCVCIWDMCVLSLQFLNQSNLHELWHESYVTGDHPNLELLSFLQRPATSWTVWGSNPSRVLCHNMVGDPFPKLKCLHNLHVVALTVCKMDYLNKVAVCQMYSYVIQNAILRLYCTLQVHASNMLLLS